VSVAVKRTVDRCLQVIDVNLEVARKHVAGAGWQNAEGNFAAEVVEAQCFDDFTDGAIAAGDQKVRGALSNCSQSLRRAVLSGWKMIATRRFMMSAY
jgi:hypothetical protein